MEQIGEQNGGKNNEKSIKKMIQKWNIDEKIRGKISRKDSYYYRHIFSKNIWFVCSKRSFCGDKEEYHACGRRTERLDWARFVDTELCNCEIWNLKNIFLRRLTLSWNRAGADGRPEHFKSAAVNILISISKCQCQYQYPYQYHYQYQYQYLNINISININI